MTIRPVDDTGDILPVLSSSDLLSGGAAAARLADCRLKLLSGEWWENPAAGCEALEMIRSGAVSARDFSALVSYLNSYILATPGVRAIGDAAASVSGRRLSYSCRAVTDSGPVSVGTAFSVQEPFTFIRAP